MAGISGDVEIVCADALAGKCGLTLGSLGIPIDMECQATECLDPQGPAILGAGGGWLGRAAAPRAAAWLGRPCVAAAGEGGA